jgi:hypothetical protein
LEDDLAISDLAMVEVNLDVIGESYYLQHATVQIMIFIELYDEMYYVLLRTIVVSILYIDDLLLRTVFAVLQFPRNS